MITRPDEYAHQNPNLAFADSDRVRGGRRWVADRAGLYALVDQADQLKAHVTIVRILADDDNAGATTEMLLVNASQIGEAAGWLDYRGAAQGAPPAVRAPVRFQNTGLVVVSYTEASPPDPRVIDVDGYPVIGQLQVDVTAKTIRFQFTALTTGTILF